MSISTRLAIPSLLLLLTATPAVGQSIWIDRGSPNTLMFEVLKPSFDNLDEDFGTTTWLLTGRFEVARRVALAAGVQLANIEANSSSSTTIGNPYLGLEFGPAEQGFSGELGLNFPTASEDDDLVASLSGVFSDVDRWESFFPSIVPVTAAANYRHVSADRLLVRGRLGSSLWIPEHDGDVEMFLLHGIWLGYEGRSARVAGGWSGRTLVTDEGVFGEDNVYHQLSVVADFGSWQVRPGASLRVPLNNDLDDIVGVTFGIHMNARL